MIALMKDDFGRKMLSCHDAAKLYGCSMRYMRRLAQEGKVASEVVGGSYVIPADEVRRLKSAVSRGTGRHKPKGGKFAAG